MTRHGHAATWNPSPTYRTWRSMMSRCSNPRDTNYPEYGGRGIVVCDRWRSFENFLADMGERPTTDYSIDRINPRGNYEPSNCRWATRSQQQKNKRPSSEWKSKPGRNNRQGWAKRRAVRAFAYNLANGELREVSP